MTRQAPRPPAGRASAVYTIPPTAAFLDTLIDGIQARVGDDPAALAEVRVLLPTRRACRSLAEAFLRRSGGRPLILPRMTPLGDIDEDELPPGGLDEEGLEAADAAGIPPAIPAVRRQLLLTRLILARGQGGGSPEHAARLAGELARLIDQAHTERLDLDRLETLAPERYANHWRLTLEHLRIISEHWPAILAEEGAIDPADRRNRLLAAQAQAWTAAPPDAPVIAAGSTGSIPATADLLAVVARLPRSAVILPGVDAGMSDAAWDALGPSHPQFGMARLLRRLGVDRRAVGSWVEVHGGGPAESPRVALVREALVPADAIDRPPAVDRGTAAAALAGVRRIDCPTPREEAAVVALRMREALEAPGRTAALVTPDRDLARRVAAALGRWGLAVNDSAGLPLAQTPPGAFLRLTARMVADHLAPVPLLAALKHPLAAGGMAVGTFRNRVRELERRCLRGPRPGPGIDGLRRACADAHDDSLIGLLDQLETAVAPFTEVLGAPAAGVRPILEAHARMAETLAASDDESGAARLWAGDAGETAAAFVAELADAAADLPAVPGVSYPALLEALLEGRVVRPRFGGHPRLAIWGPLEARLQRADVMILGGLNEGSWPPEVRASPWMSRPMMAAFGLPLPERRIGLAAHDFVQAFAAPDVTLTRSRRVDGTPTVPARWLLRIETVAGAAGAAIDIGADYLAWAEALDRSAEDIPQPVPPPAPTPPVAARPRSLSATRIETWIRDPYAIYARHVLGLEPLEPLDADPGAADRGTMIHDALDAFCQAFPDTLPADAELHLLDFGRQAFAGALARPGVRAYWWPRFERIAAWFVDFEHRRRENGVRLLAAESRGELTLDGPAGSFRLTARADRIDRLTDGGLAILDYKTGAVPSPKQVGSGLSPQLPLEAMMAEGGAFDGVAAAEVSTLAYVRLSGGRTPGEESVLKLDVAEVTAAARDGLLRLIAQYDDPATPYLSRVRPFRTDWAGDYDHLARVREWLGATAEGIGEA